MPPPNDFLQKYDVASEASGSVLGTIAGAGLATATDVVTTLWNSLPFTTNVRTEDVLGGIDKDALRVFQENPDTIHSLSFIGGAVVPGGLGVKLLGRARAGVTALGLTENFIGGSFTGARAEGLAVKLQELYKEAGPSTAAYRSTVRQAYAANITREVIDNSVIELAVAGGINAHPYMEDYWKDPIENMLIGTALGTGFGLLFAIPGTHRLVTGAVGELGTTVNKASFGDYIPVNPSGTSAGKYQHFTQNIQKFGRIVEDESQFPITREQAASYRLDEAASQETTVQYAADWLYGPANTKSGKRIVKDVEQKEVVEGILALPGIQGVDKIRIYDLDKTPKGIPTTAKIFNGAVADTPEGMINARFLTPEGKPAMAFIRPGTGEIFNREAVSGAALMVDSPKAQELLKIPQRDSWLELRNPVNGFGENNWIKGVSSARSDAEFGRELKLADKASGTQINGATIAPDHLPRMNALISRGAELEPTTRDALLFNLRSDLPTYSSVRTFVATATKVGKDYDNRLSQLITDPRFGVYPKVQNETAKQLLLDWQGGGSGMTPLRQAMDAFLHGTRITNMHWYDAAKEIWEVSASIRAEYAKIADVNGFVYLHRGSTNPLTSHAPVEGYSDSVRVAQRFGDPNLIKVHTDNIIGAIQSGEYTSEREILVTSPHFEKVNEIPYETGTPTKVDLPTTVRTNQVTYNELVSFYSLATERQVRDMFAAKNFSTEEISARLNITKEAVEALAAGHSLSDGISGWRRYTDASKIESEYLHPRNRLYGLLGNPVKNQIGEFLTNLDGRFHRIAGQEIAEQMTLASGSKMGADALSIYEPIKIQLERVHEQLGQINNALVGNPHIQSADNALRHLAEGPTMTWVGKQVIDTIDKIKRKYAVPLAQRFLPVKDNPIVQLEFNGAYNFRLGLKGWADLVEDGGVWKFVQKGEKEGEFVDALKPDGTPFVVKEQATVDAINAMREPWNEIFKMENLVRGLTGQAPMNDLGLYFPPPNPVNKSRALVIDVSGKTKTSQLLANNAAELDDLVATFKKENADNPSLKVLREGDKEAFNLEAGYVDYDPQVTVADVSKQHRGSSALAIVPSDERFLENTLQSLENRITYGVRKYSEVYLNDSMAYLDKLSGFYQQSVAGQPKRPIFKEAVPDAALTVKNILLGRDQLEQAPLLKAWDNVVTMGVNRGIQVLNAASQAIGIGTAGKGKAYWEKLVADLREKGIEDPYKGSYDLFLATTRRETRNLTPELISTGNGLMATAMLRFLEMGQPVVNMMSLPILTWSALMERMPGTVINAGGDTLKLPLQHMYRGVRSMFDPVALDVEKTLWEPRSLTKQTLRQYTDLVTDIKRASMGGDNVGRALDAMRKLQSSEFVEFLSKPADFAEDFTRRYAMHTGFQAAKTAYPGIDDMGATIAATAFTDRAIGNYHPAQRPTVFQGSFGSALGLFQTYFLTFAQSVYRGLEEGNFRQLATLTGTQLGLFGMASWPGFNLVSEQVVARFNDKHYDLTTGTFRAADKHVAEMILYGLPSSLGPSFYTRGDISPRIPSTMGELAILNGVKEGWNAAHQIVSRTSQGINNGTPIQSLFEALSLQSLNRPIARWSELVTGSSITRQGNTVSPQNEVWTPIGVSSRLLSVRPIEEQVTRNAQHLSTYYGQVDFENRQNAVRKLKTAVRDGDVSDGVINHTAEEYLRFGGSAKGWNSAVNEVLSTSGEGTRASLLRKLEPDSPVRKMIQDMY